MQVTVLAAQILDQLVLFRNVLGWCESHVTLVKTQMNIPWVTSHVALSLLITL